MNTQNSQKQNSVQDIFNIRPAAVKKWVEELPLGSTGESSKQLYHALKKVNQQHNSLDHHLEFLETISPTLTLLYPRLSKYFTDIALPLNTKTSNVIHITTSLLTQILHGYHSILKIYITKKSFGWKKPFSLALHRSIIYSSQILCTHRLSYQPYSKGTWRQIFWCYHQAEKFKLLNKSFRHETNLEKTTIEYEFKKLLLLSLLSANDLGQKNMQEVHNLMPLWINNSEIIKKEAHEKETCFTLNLLSDISPYLIGTHNDKTKQPVDRHFFSTSKLKNTLNGYLNNIEDGGAIKIGKNILSKSTIQSLLSSWSRSHLRTEVRKDGTGFVDIITGITAIHFVLNQQDQPAYDEVSTNSSNNIIDFESTLTIEPLTNTTKNDTLNLDHFLSYSDQEEDVWGKVYENTINETTPKSNWTESGIYKAYSFTKSILLDSSKEGYRLSVNSKKVDSLKHNELIAVREHALAPWALAQVKWLHFSAIGDVQFGLRILTRHTLPIHVRYKTNNTLCKPLPCLLALDRKKLMLFVPTLPTNLDGKKLQVEHQKQQSHFHLKNKILNTPAFDVYEIYEPQPDSHASSQDIKKPENIIESNNKTNLNDNIWESF
ncbi:MAG: hypothetical protein OEY65_02255 [Gammaproteobacteria bacterium]|nr:hypothetical protein [Gammaproteobacteria bacterium]